MTILELLNPEKEYIDIREELERIGEEYKDVKKVLFEMYFERKRIRMEEGGEYFI